MSEARDTDDCLDAHALLVCGAYGTGKTSLVKEMANHLEERGVRYAAIDMDWLGWFDTGEPDHDAGWPILLRNLGAVVSNYHGEGVRRFLVAGTMGGKRDLAELRSALRMPVSTVLLTLPIEEIERRLGSAMTTGRAHDLEVAREQVETGRGANIGDLRPRTIVPSMRSRPRCSTGSTSALGNALRRPDGTRAPGRRPHPAAPCRRARTRTARGPAAIPRCARRRARREDACDRP